ncbi:hypothetical protein EV122DRAFT_266557 [Schizophyllum commune]
MDHTPRTAIILASILFLLVRPAVAHVAAWHKSMWCLNGTTPGVDNPNNREPGTPLYNLKFEDWWFHHINKPANGHFTIEHATDRAFTTLSYDGNMTGVYIDGKDHLEGLDGGGECITNPNRIHGRRHRLRHLLPVRALKSDARQPRRVHGVVQHPLAPPRDLRGPEPARVPRGGVYLCGCGQPNMYMLGFRCRVTGQPGHLPLATPRSAVYCGEGKSATPAALRKNPKCVKGAKKFLSWQQKEGNTVHEKQWADERGQLKFPGYNARMGFADGAQHDIFDTRPTFASLGGFFGIWRIMAAGHLAAGAVF